MNLTDQIDESLIYFLCILLTTVIIILSWLSTNVREFVLPGNLLVIERRSRRLYTTTVNGNLNRIINPQHISSNVPTTSNSLNHSEARSNNQTNNEATTSTNITATTVTQPYSNTQTNRQIDLVDEMVEQALVDNLLDGTYYTTNRIDVANRNAGQSNPSTTTSETTNENESTINEADDESTESDDSSDLLINILIKFVNEKEMKIQARPNDTILFLKRTHFATELSSNKIVRFIYQGQFLCDKNTIKFYNIKDKTTIHCHITSKQPNANTNNNSINNEHTASSLRQRINNHQINSIVRLTGGANQNTSESFNLDGANSNSTTRLPESSLTTPSTSTSTATDNSQSTINSTNSIRIPLNRTRSRRIANQHHNMINTATIINVDLTNIFLPFFAVLLGSFWYIRVHFKHFFTPFSTLVLFLISFIYALFLFNNIYTSSFLEANNQLIINRLFSRRLPSSQEQSQQNHAQQIAPN